MAPIWREQYLFHHLLKWLLYADGNFLYFATYLGGFYNYEKSNFPYLATCFSDSYARRVFVLIFPRAQATLIWGEYFFRILPCALATPVWGEYFPYFTTCLSDSYSKRVFYLYFTTRLSDSFLRRAIFLFYPAMWKSNFLILQREPLMLN